MISHEEYGKLAVLTRHSPSMKVAWTLRESLFRIMKSPSEPKLKLPLVSSIPNTLAGFKVAVRSASVVEQLVKRRKLITLSSMVTTAPARVDVPLTVALSPNPTSSYTLVISIYDAPSVCFPTGRPSPIIESVTKTKLEGLLW